MIRINIIPVTGKRKKRRKKTFTMPSFSGTEPLWWALYAGFLVLWIIGLGVLYVRGTSKLEALQDETKSLKIRYEELEAKTKKLQEIEDKLNASKKLEETIASLNKARTGPSRLLLELSRVLSAGKGPSVDPRALAALRKDNPLAGFNENWDVRRLWIRSFEEKAGACKMSGLGKTNDDVAEFLRRLSVSDLFDEVTLQRTRAQRDTRTGADLVAFDLTCKVIY